MEGSASRHPPGAVRCPTPPPLAAVPHVVVVGQGSPAAAAAGLAERGVSVEVLEREAQPGRAGGRLDRTPGGRAAGRHRVAQQPQVPCLLPPVLQPAGAAGSAPTRTWSGCGRSRTTLVDGEGRRDTFRGLPQSPPWNAIVFALRSPTFRFRDLVRINGKAAAPLATVSVPPGIYEQLDDRDAGTFLDQINFPRAARHLAFGCSPAASSPGRIDCRRPNWRRCSTSTSSAPARAWCSMSRSQFRHRAVESVGDYLVGRGVVFPHRGVGGVRQHRRTLSGCGCTAATGG